MEAQRPLPCVPPSTPKPQVAMQPLQVRRRKGLAVEEKVVESATKQRTRARKV